MGYAVEKVFEYKGLICVVVMRPPGYRCGYVGISKDHCLYGKDYHEHLSIKKNDIKDKEITGIFSIFPLINSILDENENITIEAYFQCHGGITYANSSKDSNYPIESDLWWFGFDCGHVGDKNDYETAKRLFYNDFKTMRSINYNEELDNKYDLRDDAEIRTLEYVSNECKRLADQLIEYEQYCKEKE